MEELFFPRIPLPPIYIKYIPSPFRVSISQAGKGMGGKSLKRTQASNDLPRM